ncbi:nucleotidyltransferase family protein [Candidatus Aalborgicola defluviihabitans]|uniref:nucleotidyltransferase family protein n=1 Tax=Candidatus Aalborgicola defluviihabitans TaxID=3386187 RepID=UPI0039B856F0
MGMGVTRMAAVAGYLPQRAALDQLDKRFAGKGIPYVVIKGVYVRECVYPDPTLRPATDIDVLVLVIRQTSLRPNC